MRTHTEQKNVRGFTTIWHVKDGKREKAASRPNSIQIPWGFIAAKCIGHGDSKYKVSKMYIEYENVADPEDVATIPTFDTDEDITYYNNLSLSATKDYLRVPLLILPTIGIATGYEDNFVEGETGNKLTFYTQSQGTTGTHGKAFSAAANSKVYGLALIASPTNDPADDIVFARTYYEEDEQVLKRASDQVGVTWDISFLL